MRPSGRLAGAAALVLAALGTTPGAVADVVDHRTVLTFQDPAITESSGLVARGPLLFTVNDSGDGPRLFTVGRDSGQTLGVTTYSDEPVRDVEALAPGAGRSLWVGDIGDNNADRPFVDVYRVGAGQPRSDRRVDADRYRLAYPDGPHDAEALLVQPGNGRVHVVTKGILGGTVYAAPATLERDAVNRMREVGQVPGLVTDGAFSPDGRHILLRSYGGAAVYTFPGLRPVGALDLPAQEQGEGVAVDGRGRVFLSTEGAHSDVLEVLLPGSLRAVLASPSSAAPSADGSAATGEAADPAPGGWRAGNGVVAWVVTGLLVAGFVARLGLRASRRRSRRRR